MRAVRLVGAMRAMCEEFARINLRRRQEQRGTDLILVAGSENPGGCVGRQQARACGAPEYGEDRRPQSLDLTRWHVSFSDHQWVGQSSRDPATASP
jgi:hypothetical protein